MVNVEHNCYVTPAVGGEMDFTNPYPIKMCIRDRDTCIHEVMEVFLRPELGGLIVENLNGDNSLVDCFEGRQVTPGHAIEAMWFIMDLGKRLKRPELIMKAKNTALKMLEYG